MGELTTYLMMVGAWSIVLMGSWIDGSDALKEEAAGTVYVGGKVLCQDCTQGWNEWIRGAKPIKGCRVSITCMDGGRVAYYGSDETDEGGAFEISLKKSINGKELDLKKCSVRLVSSPDPVCNIPTLSRRPLQRPTVVYRDLIKHVVGPFYYTTPMCEEPDTSASDDDNYRSQRNY